MKIIPTVIPIPKKIISRKIIAVSPKPATSDEKTKKLQQKLRIQFQALFDCIEGKDTNERIQWLSKNPMKGWMARIGNRFYTVESSAVTKDNQVILTLSSRHVDDLAPLNVMIDLHKNAVILDGKELSDPLAVSEPKRNKVALNALNKAYHTEIKPLLTDSDIDPKATAESYLDCLRTPLGLAAQYGDVALLNRLLDGGADINGRDHLEYTPLILASRYNQISIVQALLERPGVDFLHRTRNKNNAASWAAQEGNIELMMLLVRKENAYLEEVTIFGNHLLHFMAYNDETIGALQLMAMGADIHATNSDGLQPHDLALWFQNKRLAQLINPNALPTAIYTSSDTLASAAYHDDSDQVKALLASLEKMPVDDASKQINAKDEKGNTPLSMAVRFGGMAVVNALMSHEAIDVNVKDRLGYTPLLWAIRLNKITVVEKIIAMLTLDQVSDVVGRKDDGWTVFHYAVLSNSDIKILRSLYEMSSKFITNETLRFNKDGHTGLDIAVKGRFQNTAMVSQLIDWDIVHGDPLDSEEKLRAFFLPLIQLASLKGREVTARFLRAESFRRSILVNKVPPLPGVHLKPSPTLESKTLAQQIEQKKLLRTLMQQENKEIGDLDDQIVILTFRRLILLITGEGPRYDDLLEAKQLMDDIRLFIPADDVSPYYYIIAGFMNLDLSETNRVLETPDLPGECLAAAAACLKMIESDMSDNVKTLHTMCRLVGIVYEQNYRPEPQEFILPKENNVADIRQALESAQTAVTDRDRVFNFKQKKDPEYLLTEHFNVLVAYFYRRVRRILERRDLAACIEKNTLRISLLESTVGHDRIARNRKNNELFKNACDGLSMDEEALIYELRERISASITRVISGIRAIGSGAMPTGDVFEDVELVYTFIRSMQSFIEKGIAAIPVIGGTCKSILDAIKSPLKSFQNKGERLFFQQMMRYMTSAAQAQLESDVAVRVASYLAMAATDTHTANDHIIDKEAIEKAIEIVIPMVISFIYIQIRQKENWNDIHVATKIVTNIETEFRHRLSTPENVHTMIDEFQNSLIGTAKQAYMNACIKIYHGGEGMKHPVSVGKRIKRWFGYA